MPLLPSAFSHPLSSSSHPSIAYLIRFVGSFFAINLFVGVIVDNFNRIKKETEGSAMMTGDQQQWTEAMQQSQARHGELSLRELPLAITGIAN